MIAPSLSCDVNGDYRGADGAVRRDTTFTNYTTFSLWDTYRAAHPLLTLIHPEKVGDLINTDTLRIHEQQGKLPVWHLTGLRKPTASSAITGHPRGGRRPAERIRWLRPGESLRSDEEFGHARRPGAGPLQEVRIYSL